MKRRYRTPALAIVVTMAVLAIFSGAANASVNGPPLDVSSLDIDPGEPVTVAAEGCELPNVVHVWVTPAPGTESDLAGAEQTETTASPQPDGTWSITIDGPSEPGEYRLDAACFDDSDPPEGIVYQHYLLMVSHPDATAPASTPVAPATNAPAVHAPTAQPVTTYAAFTG